MTSRWVRAAVVAVGVLCLVGLGVELAADLAAGERVDGESLANSFAGLAFTVVGVVVAIRRSEHPIGWLLLLAGALWTGSGVLAGWSEQLTAAGSRSHGAITVVGTLAFAGVGMPLAFVLLLFPTGRLVTSRWRWLPYLTGVVLTAAAVSMLLTPTVSSGQDGLELDNPFAAFPGAAIIKRGTDLLIPLSLLLVVALVVHLVVRFRRSTGVERLQLRWLVFTVVTVLTILPIVGQGVTFAFGAAVGESYGSLAFGFALASLPVGIGIAVLRYRLFEIDRLVSRTVAYLLLTGVLVGVYAVGVLGVGALLPGEPSDLLVAGATLAVAALFRPLRSRIQSVVDRRFNRSRYDAARTIEAFGARLRDEVDLGSLRLELSEAVATTVEPRAISVWLKQGAS